VRVIDSLAVYKDAEGELEVERLSNLSEDEAIELGTKIGALSRKGMSDARTPARRWKAAAAAFMLIPASIACTSARRPTSPSLALR